MTDHSKQVDQLMTLKSNSYISKLYNNALTTVELNSELFTLPGGSYFNEIK